MEVPLIWVLSFTAPELSVVRLLSLALDPTAPPNRVTPLVFTVSETPSLKSGSALSNTPLKRMSPVPTISLLSALRVAAVVVTPSTTAPV